jgi:hypothetical protein
MALGGLSYPDPIHEPASMESRPEPPAGRVSLLVAPPEALTEAETRLILDAVARHEDVLLICGDNRLDAYGLLARARPLGLENALADGVLLARAFTVHQFAALLESTLPQMAEERVAGLALVTGILEPFLDEDVRPAEARVLLSRVLRTLEAWSQRSGVPLVLSHSQVRATGTAAQLAAMIEDASGERLVMKDPISVRTIESFATGAFG